MFETRRPRSKSTSAVIMIELIYHSAVRAVRNTHGNALMSIGLNLLQMGIMVLAFYIMFSILGLRGATLRGDFLLYILSGIFLYMTHVKAMGAVSGAEGPSGAMMKHAPMNTIISICAGALSVLYIQVLSLAVILFGYHVGVTPFEVEDPAAAFGMLVLAWFTGCALGLVLLSLKPWAPSVVQVFSTVYMRANMIASGKMFVANMLPSDKRSLFDWNPLFHIIDQSRGFVFINYNPRYSNWEYPLYMGIGFLMIGLMGEFYTRQHASLSWGARQ
ncbi:ABC transporter permease [Alisedimentitalea sp. MJ-SS2]|uniref:ABC transporter permease n=1 Tax=Aliisedimentitalea sp. MJ-SS2 TaxID=3049795 RepID=UPI002914BE2F|nr:ABC transporter permease [Alisedimentitalea sp. MJ-SS2]MDU8927855.1 ABC transporter permease [Alisedimentitalea sp. MJ-SS2]